MAWLLYLWIGLAVAFAGLWVASLAVAKLLSASEPDWTSESNMRTRRGL